MKIASISGNNYNNANLKQSPSFQAIHPVKIYIKRTEDEYVLAQDFETIRTCQRKIINYLNSWKKHKTPENEEQADLIRNLYREFSNDEDFVRSEGRISSFYDVPVDKGTIRTYILTGDSVDITGRASLPIVEHNRKVKQAARKTPKDQDDLMSVKRGYFAQTKDEIRKVLFQNRDEDTQLCVYFEPKVVRGKTKYVFLDAEFLNR